MKLDAETAERRKGRRWDWWRGKRRLDDNAEPPETFSVNPSFLARRYGKRGGDVKVRTMNIGGRPVIASVRHVGPDRHHLVAPGETCRCGWSPDG